MSRSTWILLYFTTPFLLPILWWRNRRTDPGTPDPDDVVVPQAIHMGAGIAGVGLLGLAAPGVCDLLLAFEPRWSAWRILLQHQLLAVSLILIAVVRAWHEVDPASPSTWLYMVGMVGFWIALLALLFIMDARRPKVAAGGAAALRR